MTLKEFAPIYQSFKTSNLSRRAFAKANNIKEPTFNYWVRKVEGTELASDNPQFIELNLDSDSSPDKFEVLLTSGASLFVPQNFDSVSLQRLLRVLI